MIPKRVTIWFVCFSIAFLCAGCGSNQGVEPAASQSSGHGDDTHANHDDHPHPTEGPHHGILIELGNEQYHGELLHNAAEGSVTIYILDSSASKPIAIEATEINLNLRHNGEPQQFKLVASTDQADSQEKASRFVSNDPTLNLRLDEPGSDPKLVVTIDGKSFRGSITHDHTGHEH